MVTRIQLAQYQENHEGYPSSFSSSTFSLSIPPGTTIPHAARNAFNLATGKTFPSQVSFGLHRRCFDFLQSGTFAMPRAATESQNRVVFTLNPKCSRIDRKCSSAAVPRKSSTLRSTLPFRCSLPHRFVFERMMSVDNRQVPHDHCSVAFVTKGHQPSRCLSNPQVPL